MFLGLNKKAQAGGMRVFVRGEIRTQKKIIDDRLTNQTKSGTRRSASLPNGTPTDVGVEFL